VSERVYPPVIRTALTIFRLLDLRFELRGLDNIPAWGGAVLASNHVSYLDFMFVGFAGVQRDKRLVRFLAKQSVFDSAISGPLMRGMHHIAVDRSAGAGAYRNAVDALRRAELVGVFPEQTISRSFVPRPLKAGAARMALAAEVPLLPVMTWGGQRIWTTGRRPRPRRHVPVSIWIDPPLPVAPEDNAATLTERLAARLREMVDEAVANYPRPEDPSDLWWLPAHAGGTAPTPAEAAAAELLSIRGRRK
jgi:1-acyl-sn-glycerol-3-phosphate acyltransferase